MILRRLARPMVAAIFVSGGIDCLRNPEPRVRTAKPLLDKAAGVMPESVPSDAETLVKVNAAVHVGAGVALGLGRFPRLSAAALAGSMVPTTVAGHAFWEMDDPTQKKAQRTQFLKNVSMLGGLLLAAADTEGKPSVGWRARRAADKAAKQADKARKRGKETAESVRGSLPA